MGEAHPQGGSMSAEQSRLRSAIQRIAREDPERSGSLEGTGAKGDQPGGAGVGESTAERDRICCDGSTSGNANPGTSERDTSEGGQDGLDPGDPANIEAGAGELTGLVDCATGEPVCFDGGDWIPPDGWDDPQSPGTAEGYAEGLIWKHISSLTCITLDPASSCSCMASTFGQSGGGIVKVDNETYGCLRTDGSQFAAVVSGPCEVFQSSLCDAPPPLAEEWPPDDCVNLAIKNGSIVGSKYDPENDGSYSAPRKEIELCDPKTGDSILIRPSAGGGWKSIKSLAGDIDPDTQAGYLYRPNGQRVRQISPSEFRDDTV